jgi:outer membrane receptor for ferrienterochelin and colicins
MLQKIIYTLLFFSTIALGQNKISGVVYDDTGTPLQGANVLIKGTQKGTTTDEKGVFELLVSPNTEIVISYIGFKTDEITIGNQLFIKHTMTIDNTLDEVTLQKVRKSLSKSKLETTNVSTMTQKELTKAACCNLSESFETNPSIDVNFSDAVSGTRQIKMLGLTSPYIALTEELIHAGKMGMQYAGLSFIPGTWVQSIQITKGAGSVLNGFESISGQINYELVKPETEPKAYINAYASSDSRYEVNTHFTQNLGKWNTTLLLHGNLRNRINDMNKDHFLDNPLGEQLNIMNRWQYGMCGDALSSTTTFHYISDDKQAGSMHFNPDIHKKTTTYWGSENNSKVFKISNKTGYVFPENEFQSIGLQQNYTQYDQMAYFGLRDFNVNQKSYYANLLFSNILGSIKNKYVLGLNYSYDNLHEVVGENHYKRTDQNVGLFGEYTYDNQDNFSVILGARVDKHNNIGTFFTPRMHLRFQPRENITLRASAGKGTRIANIFIENQQLLATSRIFNLATNTSNATYGFNPEVAYNYGIGYLHTFKIFNKEAELSLDFYRTDFENQVVTDLDFSPQQVLFYDLKGKSYANSLQIDFNYELTENLNIRTSYKYYDVKTDFSTGLLERYLQAKHRYFINLEYETTIKDDGSQWKMDFTYNRLGSQRLPATSSNPVAFRFEEFSPSFGTINAQITNVFNENFEIYFGGENIGNFQISNPILGVSQPFGNYFDSSMVYGPVFGAMYYGGLRYKIL